MKLKLIYLICLILCVFITFSTVSATDINEEIIVDDSNQVASISQSESSITNLNENTNDIGIYSEDKDCVDSVNELSNLNSFKDSDSSDSNSLKDADSYLDSSDFNSFKDSSSSDFNSLKDSSSSDLNSINSDEKSLKSSLSAINSNNMSYENDLNPDSLDSKNALKSNSLGASTSSFAELQIMINNAAAGSTINLGGKTFIGNGTYLKVNKSITIDGGSIDNKATLDAKSLSYILIINCNKDVHLINCNFINGLNNGVTIFSNNSSIKNCNFLNNNLHLYTKNGENFLIEDCNFTNGYREEGTNVAIITNKTTVRNCNFINNTIFNDTGVMGFGAALQIGALANATNEGYVINCKFINNTVNTNHNETHAGALCFRPGIKVSNSLFINNYCNKIGGATTLHADGEIVNCTFINNTAGEYGGAISTGFEYDDISVNITNCTFINNSAPMGGAIQIKGHSVKVTNSIFEDNKASEKEGGAVFIIGDEALIINSSFNDNFAKTYGAGVLINGSDVAILNSSFDGNIADYGAAVFVIGSNANLFSSNFTNHNVKNGSVYIKGLNTYIYDSIFLDNLGEVGAGVFIEGLNSTVILSNFSSNNASDKGGAIYIDGSDANLILSNFLNNNAIPDISNINSGLGGAIYIKGDNNIIDSSNFNYNTARNGSAIYTDGLNMTLSNTNFDKNQAWSYILDSTVYPAISYFNESDILINLTLIGGNNIANAIYNTASIDEIYFYNVSYISSKGQKTTGKDEIHPVNGAQNSKNGTLLYQDDREDNQLINVIIFKDSQLGEKSEFSFHAINNLEDKNIENAISGDIILNETFKTGILGDVAFNLSDFIDQPLEAGKYLLYAKHIEDDYYKEIDEENQFDIIPLVDLAINIGSSRVNIDFNKTVKYTIKVNNYGPSNASGVNVSAIIPNGLIYLSSTPSTGSYNPETGIWSIGDLDSGDNQTLIISLQTNKTGLIDYPVNVSSIEDDSDLSNNFNNKTIRVLMADLEIDIEACEDVFNYGDTINWTVTVKNNGPNNASKLIVSFDSLNQDLIYLNCSNDTFNASSLKWEIPSLSIGDEISIVISTKANSSNKEITLNANVSADTYDPVESNNLDSDNVNVLPLCDLITKVTVSNSSANNGDILDWLVLVSNDGPDDAFNVVVSLSDLQSLGAIILDSSDDSFDKESLEWNIGDLAGGESISLTISTQIDSSQKSIPFEGNASSQTFELNYENNYDEDILAIDPLCDLQVTIIPDNNPVNIGETVNWIINVTNNGPDNASDVNVLNDLPEGLEYIVFESNKGEVENITDENGNMTGLVWKVGDLENNESAFLIISTKTLEEGNLLNNASVNSSTLDSNQSNNFDSANLDVLPVEESEKNNTDDNEKEPNDNPEDNPSDDPYYDSGDDLYYDSGDDLSEDSEGNNEGNPDDDSNDESSDDSEDNHEEESDEKYDGYYDDYPWYDYNFLDDSNENENPKDNLDKSDSLNSKSKESPIKKNLIDISSKKTGNPLIFAILSILALFSLRLKEY